MEGREIVITKSTTRRRYNEGTSLFPTRQPKRRKTRASLLPRRTPRSSAAQHLNTRASRHRSVLFAPSTSGVERYTLPVPTTIITPVAEDDEEPVIEFTKVGEQPPEYSKRFRRLEHKLTYRCTHNLGSHIKHLLQRGDGIDQAFGQILAPLLEKRKTNDIIFAAIQHEELNKDIFIKPQRVATFNPKEFLNAIHRVTQSNEKFLLDGRFFKPKVVLSCNIFYYLGILTLKVSFVEGTKGGMRFNNPQERSYRKRSVIQIKNRDNSCFYRALFLGLKFHELNEDCSNKEWKKLQLTSEQAIGARNLCKLANADFLKEADEPVFQLFQDTVLKDRYQLVIVEGAGKGPSRTIRYRGHPAEKQIFLEFHEGVLNGHFNLIKKMSAYLDRNYYCFPCNLGFNRSGSHNCENFCKFCRQSPRCVGANLNYTCVDCNRSFLNENCYKRHLSKICKTLKKCTNCEVEFNTRHSHECGAFLCRKCGEQTSETPHYCMIKILNRDKIKKQDELKKTFVSCDIESFLEPLETTIQGKIVHGRKHVPMLLKSLTACDSCWDSKAKKKNVDCSYCGDTEDTFRGDACVSKFATYVIQLAKETKRQVIVFAHNMRSYDGHFIIQELFKKQLLDTSVLMTGNKLLKMECSGVRFIDSLSFFQQPLSALPKAFGLVETKGFFPHLFNHQKNYSYCGKIPDLQYFDVENLSPSKKQEIQNWHSNWIGEWNLKEELEKYCQSDVNILMQAMMTFRTDFKQITGICPLSRCFTLASIGIEVFRTLMMQKNTIGIPPISGYKLRKNSFEASAYLDWLEKYKGAKIKREVYVGPYTADGMIEDSEGKRTAIEYFGCFYHGCPCTHFVRDIPIERLNGQTAEEAFNGTQNKLASYRKRGIDVISVWGCEARREKEKNPAMAEYLQKREKHYRLIEKVRHINIRDSFFGGRTNNVKFYHQVAEPDEALHYYDITSLYPWVLMYNEFPIGHPDVLNEFDSTDISGIFGFIKCKVLPPKQLYLPVLPYRTKDKLLFPLCKACTDEKCPESCPHTDSDRCFVGAWTHIELQLAIEQGYQVLEIYQALHYQKHSSEMFKDYIRLFLKLKTEASGWPSNCPCECKGECTFECSNRVKFLAEFEEREGIKLDPSKIIKNPALRTIAKLMLNSFWGKLAQRPNLPQTEICNDYESYFSLLSNEELEILGEYMVTDSSILVNFKKIKEENVDPGNTSVAIASFVTSYARTKLYSIISKIKRGNLFYFDTDSVIFRWIPGEFKPELDNFLGKILRILTDDF